MNASIPERPERLRAMTDEELVAEFAATCSRGNEMDERPATAALHAELLRRLKAVRRGNQR